ncbi:hypothetical protein BH11VER1_BH11VER1_42310 [soil metagenome]
MQMLLSARPYEASPSVEVKTTVSSASEKPFLKIQKERISQVTDNNTLESTVQTTNFEMDG